MHTLLETVLRTNSKMATKLTNIPKEKRSPLIDGVFAIKSVNCGKYYLKLLLFSFYIRFWLAVFTLHASSQRIFQTFFLFLGDRFSYSP